MISAPNFIDYSNSTLSGLYRVAVLVLSAPKNREKRRNIRKLRLPGCHLQVSCKLQKNNWSWTPQFLFLIGQTGSSTIEENLQEVSKRSLVLQKIVQHEMVWWANFQERETHDDILRLSVKESYRTLPRQEKKSWWSSVIPNIFSSADGCQSFWIYSLLLRKTLGGFSFVASKLPNVDLLLKLDDDLDIRSPLKYQQCFFSLSTSLNPRVNILGQ